MEPTNQNTSPAVPIAIVAGFAMIALAIFLTNQKSDSNPTQVAKEQASEVKSETTEVRPVGENDYIRGNPNAPILMVEYSDYDCPFCKQYHNTMNQIMDEYGITGKIAWAYRQFPLVKLHPNAQLISEAALCVGDIGKNEAFWKFTDMVFNERGADEQTNVTKLVQFAEASGVSVSDYKTCMESDRMRPELEAQITDGFNSGARGTPYTVLIVGNQQAIINGAQPYATVKGIVENLIEQLEGNFDTDSVQNKDIPKNSQGVPILE